MEKNIVIHISGPSGSGKTTLGNKLIKKYGKRVTVKDIDDLRQEFIKSYYGEKKWTIINKTAYQSYINKFIAAHSKTPLIWVGLNIMPWWHAKHYYNMHADYKFYIDLDNGIIHQQKCERFLSKLGNLRPNEKNDMVNNNERFLRLLKRGIDNECDKKTTFESNDKLVQDYKKQKYEIASREDIYSAVCKILNEYAN